MTIRHDQIQPTVIVIIQEAGAPTKKRKCDLAESGEISHVSEIRIAVIVIKHIRIVREIRDLETDPARVIVITDRNSHPRLLASVLVQRHT